MMLADETTFLIGDDEMSREIATQDWSGTPLGPMSDWPAALRVALGTLLSSKFPKALCWGPELLTFYNDGFRPILGDKHPCMGQPFSQIWAEAWETIGPIADRALQGEATYIEDFPLVINRYGYDEEAFFTFAYSPITDETGAVVGMLDTVVETTAKVRAERSAELRIRELVHRSRNTFSLVSALVKQTHRTARTLQEAEETISQRLNSLINAQAILAGSNSMGAEIESVVSGALAPFRQGSGHVTVSGPPLTIGPEQVIALAMAVHELGTNASKYGALTAPEGHVTITWKIAPAPEAGGEPEFVFSWVETNGPAVTAPERRGFGSFLVGKAFPHAFQGSFEQSYAPEGYHCTMRCGPQNLTVGLVE
ncbi:sensor histidine kinase [Pacificitalea manganoxidans]|nr:HWE histidine kinase domain-containing protein [Pacificitalea manganoxidans]MDR6307818.1 two-component sensor histidine kinase [Pacificitalea manganoxidans]